MKDIFGTFLTEQYTNVKKGYWNFTLKYSIFSQLTSHFFFLKRHHIKINAQGLVFYRMLTSPFEQ